ncbi:MAG TPA: flippase [Sphingobacteriaceae bacterium]
MRIPAIPGFDQSAFEKYFKNTGWLMLGRVGSLVIKMLVNISVANYLGKEAFGTINNAYAFVVIFLSVAGLGLDQFIVRELVNSPEKKAGILGTSVALKLFAALAIIPAILLGYQVFPSEGTPSEYVFIISLIGIFQAFNVIDAFYQAQVQAKNIMLVNIGGNVISAVVKLAFIFLQLPLMWFVIALVLDAALLALGYVTLYSAQKHRIFAWQFQRSMAGNLLSKSWPLMFSAVLVTLYMKIDQVMIGRMLGEAPLGIYSTVVSLSEAWYFIPMAIVSSVFPAIITAKKQDEKRYQKRLQNLYDLMVFISMGIAVVMTFCSSWVYDLLYDPEFSAGAPVLAIHVWAGVFVFLGVASGQYLINEGLTGLSLFRTAVGAVVNIVLNLVLLPVYGIAGAAWATLIAYACATFSIIFIPGTSKTALMMLKSLFLISLIQKLIKR